MGTCACSEKDIMESKPSKSVTGGDTEEQLIPSNESVMEHSVMDQFDRVMEQLIIKPPNDMEQSITKLSTNPTVEQSTVLSKTVKQDGKEIVKRKKHLETNISELSNKIDQLMDLIRFRNGETMIEHVGDHIYRYLFTIVNSLLKYDNKIEDTKNILKNISKLYNKNSDKQLMDRPELSYEQSKMAIQKIFNMSDNHCTDVILNKIRTGTLGVSYIDILETIIQYNASLIEQCLELHIYITDKFRKKATRYRKMYNKISSMISNLQDVNQTLNDYINKLSSFNDLFIINFIKIANDIVKNGLNQKKHELKLGYLMKEILNYSRTNMFIADSKKKAIKDDEVHKNVGGGSKEIHVDGKHMFMII